VGKAADHVLAIDETDVGVFPGRADADLIAEAPNLLKACLEAKRAIEQGCKAGAKARVERDERIIAILGNAIARATP